MLSLVSLLLAAPLALATPAVIPVEARQIDPGCEGLQPFIITGFTSVETPEGSGTPSTISFTLTDPNPAGEGPALCTATFPDGGSLYNGSLHFCEFPSSSWFTYRSPNLLMVLQPIVCQGGQGAAVVASGTGTPPVACVITDPEGPITCEQDGEFDVPITGAI